MLINATSALGGTGKQSLDDLRQLMAGKVISFGATVDEDAFVTAASTTSADLATQLKLSAAYLTDPGFRPEAYNQWTNIVPLIVTQTSAQPQGVAQALVPMIYANGDTRFGLPPIAALQARSFAEAKAAYAPVAATAPIDIGIVGDIDEAAVIAAVAQSFGALPRARRHRARLHCGARRALPPGPRAGHADPQRRRHAGDGHRRLADRRRQGPGPRRADRACCRASSRTC